MDNAEGHAGVIQDARIVGTMPEVERAADEALGEIERLSLGDAQGVQSAAEGVDVLGAAEGMAVQSAMEGVAVQNATEEMAADAKTPLATPTASVMETPVSITPVTNVMESPANIAPVANTMEVLMDSTPATGVTEVLADVTPTNDVVEAALTAEQEIQRIVGAAPAAELATPGLGEASEKQIQERLEDQQMQLMEEAGEGKMAYTMLVHDKLTKPAVQQLEREVAQNADHPDALKRLIDKRRKQFIYDNYGWMPESEN